MSSSFENSSGLITAYTDWFNYPVTLDDFLLASAFKEAGDKIIEALKKNETRERADIFFMPLSYLYRHSLELMLKGNIKLGIRLEIIFEDDKLSNILKSHNLHRLWNYVKEIIMEIWPDGPKDDINAAEKIIQEFHKMDKSSQRFRYAEKFDQKKLEELPHSVDLVHLQDVFDAIFNYLDSCASGLDAIL